MKIHIMRDCYQPKPVCNAPYWMHCPDCGAEWGAVAVPYHREVSEWVTLPPELAQRMETHVFNEYLRREEVQP